MILGVNIHDKLGPDTPYANVPEVAKAILSLGAKVIRGISYTNTAGVQWCADNHVGALLMPPPKVADVTVDAYRPAADIAKKAGIWFAIEGLNEAEGKTPSDKSYTDWISYVRAHQTALFNVGKTLDVTVLGPSIGSEPDKATGRAMVDLVGHLPMDRLNIHSYAWPWTSVPNIGYDVFVCAAGLGYGHRPVLTETGMHTEIGGQVSEDLQAQIHAAAWDRAKAAGCTVYCAYELVDQWRTNDPRAPFNSEWNFGLFRHDWTPKPAVAALRQRAHGLKEAA